MRRSRVTDNCRRKIVELYIEEELGLKAIKTRLEHYQVHTPTQFTRVKNNHVWHTSTIKQLLVESIGHERYKSIAESRRCKPKLSTSCGQIVDEFDAGNGKKFPRSTGPSIKVLE